MQVDDPPYLSVGTAVSAKYKGAFCEAKVSKVVRIVKCKVTYKMGLGNATVNDEQIKGTLRVGQLVQAKHSEKKDFVDATITKIQDCSQYTVVFDDGDITTLRRTALCLKSGRHFNESETLDQLPLTHPEHFGNPVVVGRRGRRNRQQIKEESSEGEAEEENEPDLEGYTVDIGRVVSVESTDKKRNKDNWFPGLVVIPSAQPTVRINIKDEYLIRSFKDGRYYTVPKKEVSEFNRELGEKVESAILAEAVQKALKYLDNSELPVHWERNSLFNSQNLESDSDENITDSSDDEPCEEKDRFVAQLYKFMDEAGTPLNKTPTVHGKDVDLHGLFRLVEKLGGYNRVTNKNKWRSVTLRLHLSNTQNAFNQVKSIYKKCLLSYESFNRTLGVTMLNHTRATKKNRGRSLIRDKDRATPVNSPKLEKEDELISKDDIKKEVVEPPEPPSKAAIKRIEKKEKEIMSDTNSSDAAEPLEAIAGPSKEIVRPKRIIEAKTPVPVLPVVKEKKLKATGPSEKVKAIIEKFEEQVKVKEEEDKMPQQTRSKSVLSLKAKEPPQPSYSPPLPPEKKELKTLTPTKPSPISSKPLKKPEFLEEKKQRGRKRINLEEKSSTSDDSSSQSHTETPTTAPSINIGDKLKVYYGPRQESKVTYEAKIIDIDKDALVPTYFVHYTGWNNRYDEWITVNRIAENLSATTKAKRLRTGNVKGGNNAKGPGKRGRGVSLTGRSSVVPEIPRSTTPSSVTSSSSRTKSPATPATRSVSRMNARQDSLSSRRTRRTSAQTDASLQSESESEVSESEAELTRTRSGSKSDEAEIKTYKRRAKLQTPKIEIKKEIIEDEEVEEEGKRTMSTRKRKKSSDSDEESLNVIAKGRDFDLNQIRSELKGFTKAAASKVPTLDSTDKDTVSSADDSATIPQPVQPLSVDEVVVKQSPSSEDIYEFKEPEPFEFESRPKLLLVDEKAKKRLVPRVFDELEKSPPPPPPVLPVIITPQPKKKLNLKSPDSEEKKSRSFRRTTTPIKKSDSDDEDDIALLRKDEDPFDKLVESPSFNIVKTATEELKSKAVRNLLDGPLSLFREIPDSDDMILSDSESQSQHIFSRDGELFSDSFMKSSPDHVPLDLEFPIKVDDCKMKDSDDDDLIIQEQIQRVIQQSSSTDEDDSTSDTLVVAKQPAAVIVEEMAPIVDNPVEQEDVSETVVTINIPEENVIVVESSAFAGVKQTTTISPALQETDSSLLESICTMPNLLASSLDAFPVPVKSTGTKIADSLLQKFKSIGSKVEEVLPPAPTPPAPSVIVKEEVVETVKEEIIPEEIKPVELVVAKVEVEEHFDLPPAENKKRKKVISRAYIEESDSDSSDSEQLVIARSDEDSQTISIGNKGENDSEDQDSNVQLPSTDDSQTQQPVEERNFKFDPIKTEDSLSMSIDDTEMKLDVEAVKEEEPDSQLHSLLLCEETLPRSPAPVAEVVHVVEPKPAKSVSEMPFASAPGTSNAKSILLEHKVVAPSVIVPIERDTVTDANAVLVNTPPTTPESSISNLSPRGENSGLSPNTGDNESCKSSHDAEIDYNSSRRNSANKLSPYSEEDTQMTGESSSTTIVKKMREEPMMPIVKKRRKSLRGPEDVPAKRGRKPLNRSRHNSDSDDTSDHSNAGSATLGLSERRHRSPRPSKYNFFVEFDPSLDSSERIALLQQKLSDLRKTYADVKTELAAVERRRKKIKRREREAQRASKQELACA